jgi:hypothetical protein
MMRPYRLPDIDISSSDAQSALDRVFGDLPTGSITLAGRSLYDWRAEVWYGEIGPMVMGTWGRWPAGPLVMMPESALGAPCPTCRQPFGFHDDEAHAALVAIPPDKLMPTGDSKRARVRLSDDEIAERREAARQRREGAQ